MRGETRVRPGESRPAAAPIVLRARGGLVDLVLGVALAAEAQEVLDALLPALGEPTLAGPLASVRAGRAVAVVRTRDAAVTLASA
jgi:hypothetical protein